MDRTTIAPHSTAEAGTRPGQDEGLRRGPLYALALGTFAVGTEGFMIAAILPSIAHDLSTSVQATGQLVTIFALVYALSSPVLTALTGSFNRRRLLMLSLAAFAVANLLAAIAPGYWSLVVARIVLALAAGLYVPNANGLAGSLAPPRYRGRALAIVNGGITVAVAIGVPLGALVGTHLGWRMTFVGVAAISALALGVLHVRLPRSIAGSPPASLKARLAVIAHPAALSTLLVTTLWAIGAYTVYTYISPFVSAATGLGTASVGAVLFVYGLSALLGVIFGGNASDRFGPRRVETVALPAMMLAFIGLSVSAWLLAPGALVPVLLAVLMWGVSAWGFFPSQQNRLIGVVGLPNTSIILSLNASFMYFGFSIGAVLGSLVIGLSSIFNLGFAGAICVLLALALSQLAWRRTPAAPHG